MNKIRTIIISFVAVVGLVATPLVPVTVSAADVNPITSIGDGVKGAGGKDASTTELTDFIKTIVNVMLFILGAIAVLMIIIGGIRYTTSNGDANSTKGAKDTILYAVIGLIVAILAYAIVNFVVASFKSNG
jgi:hypothetical protein